ncbi:MAG: four helix bundle protein [Ignavibacteriaceae bacterium]
MKVKRFEDLQVWQDSRSFVKSIYELTSSTKFSKDYGLRDQIQRASVSIMNNISEGFERDSNREFIKFLGYSKGSAGEVRSMLYVALDLKYITKEEFELAYNTSLNIITQLANFIKYLRTYTIKQNINKIKNIILNLFN